MQEYFSEYMNHSYPAKAYKLTSYFYFFFLVLTATGCATVTPEYVLPTQDLKASPPKGKTRVIFYNGNRVNPLFMDFSWRIGIKLSDKVVENLHMREYVQLFLKPASYKVELSHFDLITLNDLYYIKVENDSPIYIQAYNTPISTKYTSLNLKNQKTSLKNSLQPEKQNHKVV